MPRIEFLFPHLSGGLLNGVSDDFAPDDGLRVADDIDFGKAPIGGITIRPPIYNRNLAPADMREFYWLIRFRGYDTDNFPFLLICSERWQDDDGRWHTELTARFIDQNLSELTDKYTFDRHMNVDRDYAIQDENKVYFVGSERDIYYSPVTLVRESGNLTLRSMGFPSERIRSLTPGSAGDMDDGTYYYQLILTDANGHRSAPLPLAPNIPHATTNAGANAGSVQLGDEPEADRLPMCDGEHKYLYRTVADVDITGENPENYPVFYLVKILHGTADVYVDTLNDDDLINNEILDMNPHTPPAELKAAVIHNGRMWGFERKSSVLRYSEQFDYENWPLRNTIPIGDPDYLAGIASVGDKLLLFKKTKIYAFWGDSLANFDYREIASTHGTKYPKTIRTLSDTVCIFLDSQKRVMMFDGSGIKEISKVLALPDSSAYWATVFGDYYILWLYEDGDITGYAYYLSTGKWAKWTDTDMLNPEEPNRPGLDHLVYWNGSSICVLGRDFPGLNLTTDVPLYRGMTIRTQNVDCGQALQEKAFKEIEIYLEPLDPTLSFNGMVGQLEFIPDEGGDLESSFQQTISYNSNNPSDRRQRFRIKNGVNGTRGSVRFIGNQSMKDFALLQFRLHWEPRGSPQRG